MKAHHLVALLFSSLLTIPPWQAEEVDFVAKEVLLLPIGPFGETLTDCHVDSFQAFKERPLVDRRDRFKGLTGKNVPYGEYSVDLRCSIPEGVQSMAGGVHSTVTVRNEREFLVISSHRHLGHFVHTLRVTVRTRGETTNQMWVKMVGLYLNRVFVARVDPATSYAEISGTTPGDYVLMLLRVGDVVCSKKIRLLTPTDYQFKKSLTIDIGRGCEIVEEKGVSH